MPLCDCHLHTRISNDADQSTNNTAEQFCLTAIEKNISHIAFTEHFDLPGHKRVDYSNPEESFCAVSKAKDLFNHRLDVIFGMEIGQMHTSPDEAQSLIQKYKPDFVIGSLHVLADGTDIYGYPYHRCDEQKLKEIYRTYLDELYDIAQNGDFDTLAHCTYALRYYHERGVDTAIKLEWALPYYERIFKKLIERGKSLELNTSRFSHDNSACVFMLEIIKHYIKLGGKMITLGSDSHFYGHMGHMIEEMCLFLKQNGLDGVYVYHNRQPQKIKI